MLFDLIDTQQMSQDGLLLLADINSNSSNTFKKIYLKIFISFWLWESGKSSKVWLPVNYLFNKIPHIQALPFYLHTYFFFYTFINRASHFKNLYTIGTNNKCSVEGTTKQDHMYLHTHTHTHTHSHAHSWSAKGISAVTAGQRGGNLFIKAAFFTLCHMGQQSKLESRHLTHKPNLYSCFDSS